MAVKPSTREDYARRIARAAALIAQRPDAVPRLEELAAAAAFSPYHFHRIYLAFTGETPADTAIRERLLRAAARLLQGDEPVAVVAREAGYGSVEGFSRAFRAAHGVPPAAYRAQGGIGRPMQMPIPTLSETPMLDVTIHETRPLRLVGLRHTGPYLGVGDAFRRLTIWGQGRGLIGPDTRFIAIYHDDPHSVAPDALRADACITVPEGVEGDGAVRRIDIPALRCAMLRFKGPYPELEGVYDTLYGGWLPASGEEPGDLPAMEEYLNDPATTPPAELLTDIMLPLRARVAA